MLLGLLLMIAVLSPEVGAQRGFTDHFSDNSMQLPPRNPNASPFVIWSTVSPATYTLVEADGVLKIKYSRIPGTGAFDHFDLTPPFPVNVSRNPHIQLKIRSSVPASLTLRPYYTFKPPTYEELNESIPGDGEWHTVTFKLYDYLYERFGLQKVEFYFDQGVDKSMDGIVELDDVKVGWHLIKVENVQGIIQNGDDIHLTWQSSDRENTAAYRIYRSKVARFVPAAENLIGESKSEEYLDATPGSYEQWYYRIIPVGKDGDIHLPSADIRLETFEAGKAPQIKVMKVNASTVKKYEKFEISLKTAQVGIHNPYDPEDIDIYAFFIAPEGDTIRINGFYDNYREADIWRIRFAPAKTGQWRYQVYINDAGRMAKAEPEFFQVIESEHHGWIRPSEKNPHYFVHDDGTSYYALGVYSPWRNDEERFRTFAEHQANLFAIWDIGYGGFVNETGIIEEELGKYNQEKLGRIDSLLTILEKDNIQLMYAIWPHDLFSETVWATEWDKNPYREITDVVDVYRDQLVWEYQKKKYRYLIARFAHSRSMGIWELINEMNGTDGWKEARFESAYQWVEKADQYFEENDPYRHPVTASFSGGYGEYRKPLYERNDIPNLHVYPAQGWALQYPEDTLRSDMYNYAWASRRFWNDFEKPAIFGEAGADLSYFQQDDPRYHEAYHNAIWATLSNGLAGVPVWWMYTHLTPEDWKQLSYLAGFVHDIDFANQPYAPATIAGEGIDAYAMMSGSNGFGWIRSYTGPDISHARVKFQDLADDSYRIRWFDTWKGRQVGTTRVTSKDGTMVMTVPDMDDPARDIAFKIDRVR